MRRLAGDLFILATVVAMFGFGRTASRLAKLLFFVLFLLSLPVRLAVLSHKALSVLTPKRAPKFRPAPRQVAVA